MNKAVKSLPEKVKPSYICGCDNEERKQKFMDITKEFQSLRQAAKDKMTEFTDSIKQLDEKKLNKIKKEVAKKLEEMKKKVDSYEIMLKKFIELMKDEWVPPPQIEMKQDEEKVEKINEDVKENTLIISIGKTTITNDSASLKVTLSKIISLTLKLMIINQCLMNLLT